MYSFGHLEYDRDTLAKEYHRDVKAGLDPALPKITLMRMMPIQNPRIRWNLAATTFFSNWINYAVYQETPYRLEELEKIFHFMVTYKGEL